MNNSPAFPTKRYNANTMQMEDMGGMTLRDYFAAKALITCDFKVKPYNTTDEIAKDCYRMADAMLKAREA